MIHGLSEADRSSWRARRQLPERSSDLSPDGGFASEGRGDAVSVNRLGDAAGEHRSVPVEHSLQRTTVADNGTSAFSARDTRGETHLYRSEAGAPLQKVASAFGLYGIDLSPRGDRLAFLHLDQVKVHDGGGTRLLAKLPAQLDEVHYLADGRMLVQGHVPGWSSNSVPTFWLGDEGGRFEFVSDPEVAESLEPGVLKALVEGYGKAFPMADGEQRERLLEQFGYSLPSYRQPSPDRQSMVFSVNSRLEPADPDAGIYLVRDGADRAERLPLGDVDLSQVTWRSDSAAAAVVVTRPNGDKQVCVVGEETAALPYRLEKPLTPWSGTGRYTAVQAVVGDLTTIFAYDTEKRSYLPVVTGYQLEGWKGDRLLVSRDGQTLELEPTLLDPKHAPGQLFGSPLPEEGIDPGVRMEPEHVVIGGVRVPRKS